MQSRLVCRPQANIVPSRDLSMLRKTDMPSCHSSCKSGRVCLGSAHTGETRREGVDARRQLPRSRCPRTP
eukprot:776403-Pleurochrysis_carterae.AAC.1